MAYHAGPEAEAKRKGDEWKRKRKELGMDKKANGLTRKWIEKKINRKSDSRKKAMGGKGNKIDCSGKNIFNLDRKTKPR